jgi:hypothetical protein
MLKDITFPEVKNVQVAVVKEPNGEWNVYLINRNNDAITNVFVSTYGYGGENEPDLKTSSMRYFMADVLAQSYEKIEPIDPSVFRLNNEYMVSYFIDNQLFDKKFIFVPDSIVEANLSSIQPFGFMGVLHA